MGDRSIGCDHCNKEGDFNVAFSFAFQPICDINTSSIFAYEALVRGKGGQPANTVLSQLNDENRYFFDQAIRTKAIKTAVELGIDCKLSINFFPNAIYNPETCIRATLKACEKYRLPLEQIIFEMTETEKVKDQNHLKNIVDFYRKKGFLTAIDDFGAGYSGLNLVVDWLPNIIKLDMHLIRNIDSHPVRQYLVKAIVDFAKNVDITIIAEGIETHQEFTTLREIGIHLFQGYYLAKPAFEQLPNIDFELLK
jgi:EAL domain-containing protein (putative c-di-GMP-specific phosphodiesterase class I)